MLQKAIEVLPMILDEMFETRRVEVKKKVVEMDHEVKKFLGPADCCHKTQVSGCNHVLCEVNRLDNLFNLLLSNRWYLLECPEVCRWARRYLYINYGFDWYTKQAKHFIREIFGETVD